MTKGCRAFLIAGSGKPRRGHEKRRRSSKQRRGHEKQARAGGSEPAPAEAQCSDEAPFMGLRGCCRLPCVCLRRWGPRPAANTWVSNVPIKPNLDSSSKTDLETCGKDRELKRKLSERALTQRKARAREEPSPGPPASETDAGPPGHQPRGGAPARPRLSRGQEGLT